jgi:hypothetical protein
LLLNIGHIHEVTAQSSVLYFDTAKISSVSTNEPIAAEKKTEQMHLLHKNSKQ